MSPLCIFFTLLCLGATAKKGKGPLRAERLFDAPTLPPVFGDAILTDAAPIISQARIIMVVYGQGTFIPEIVGSNMGTFYRQFIVSPQFTWIKQYRTLNNTNSTTEQIINKAGGVFGGRYVIPANLATTTTQNNFQNQFKALLGSKTVNKSLPLPFLDGKGFVNSLYIFHLPAGKSVSYTAGGKVMTSCVDWCGIHGSINFQYTLNGVAVTKHIPYIILPDMSPSSGCYDKCGSHNSSFLITISVAVHEIFEAVTDPWEIEGWQPGFFSGNEISDVCEGVDEGWKVGNIQYTVQRSWSNNQQHCIGNTNSSFSIFFGIVVAAFDLGTPQIYTIVSTNYTDPPQNISWNCWGLPQGWSCSFDPPIVTAGESVNLTVNSAGAAPVAYRPQLTVIGNQSPLKNTNARIKIILPVSNLINGQFNDNLSHWTPTITAGSSGNASVVGGTQGEAFAAQLAVTTGQLQLAQTFRVNAKTLTVYYYALCDSLSGNVVITIKSGSFSDGTQFPQRCFSSPDPQILTVDVTQIIGKLATLTFYTNGDQGATTFGLFYNVTCQ